MRNPANKQTDRHTKVIAISRFSRDNEQQQLEFGKKMLREWTKTQNLGKTFLVEEIEHNKVME